MWKLVCNRGQQVWQFVKADGARAASTRGSEENQSTADERLALLGAPYDKKNGPWTFDNKQNKVSHHTTA